MREERVGRRARENWVCACECVGVSGRVCMSVVLCKYHCVCVYEV